MTPRAGHQPAERGHGDHLRQRLEPAQRPAGADARAPPGPEERRLHLPPRHAQFRRGEAPLNPKP